MTINNSLHSLAHSIADRIVEDMSTEDLMSIAYQSILDSYLNDTDRLREDFETVYYCQDDPEEAEKNMVELLSNEGVSSENALQLFNYIYE